MINREVFVARHVPLNVPGKIATLGCVPFHIQASPWWLATHFRRLNFLLIFFFRIKWNTKWIIINFLNFVFVSNSHKRNENKAKAIVAQSIENCFQFTSLKSILVRFGLTERRSHTHWMHSEIRKKEKNKIVANGTQETTAAALSDSVFFSKQSKLCSHANIHKAAVKRKKVRKIVDECCSCIELLTRNIQFERRTKRSLTRRENSINRKRTDAVSDRPHNDEKR